MGQDLLLGIDIGTYESKGVLTTPQGKVIAQATIAHKLLFYLIIFGNPISSLQTSLKFDFVF